MAIIKQYSKSAKATSVSEATYSWDPERKQSRANRKLIGRLNDAGEIVPTSKTRGRKPKNVQEEQKAAPVREDEKNYETLLAALRNELEQERANSREKDKKITALEKRDHDRKQVIQQIEALIKQLT